MRVTFHQEEFDENKGFAYTILTTDGCRCIGCLYLYPFSHGVYDSVVYYWFVDDVDKTLNTSFRQFITSWIETTFELKKSVFPGRDMKHKAWQQFVERIKKGILT